MFALFTHYNYFYCLKPFLMKYLLIVILVISTSYQANTQSMPCDSLPCFSLNKFRDGIHHWDLFSPVRKYQRFDTTDVVGIANNLVAWQNIDGGWPKNIDWLAKLNIDSVRLIFSEAGRASTFDNQNIYPQIEYLSKAYYYLHNDIYKESALKGLHYILYSQHKNGGWRGSDVDAITFNDGVMIGIMSLFMDIINRKGYYNWIQQDIRDLIQISFDKALLITLQCQIIVNGNKTAWCQQHDNNSLKPVKARSYELASITAKESTDIILFLMKIDNPGDSVIAAVESAMKWLEDSKITGYKYEKVKIPVIKYYETTVDFDRVFVADTTAKPVWARYYAVETNTPFLCNRNGIVVYSLSEIDFERRVGYEWYGYWPEAAFQAYPAWHKRIFHNKN